MKINEIVSENNDLKEGWLSTLISKIPGIGSLASKLTASLTRSDAIENLAKFWAQEIVQNPGRQIITRDPMRIKDMLRNELKSDVDFIMAKAEPKAAAYARKMQLQGLGQAVSSTATKASSLFKSSAVATYKAAMTIGIAAPLYKCYQNITTLQKQLEAGEITQEQFDEQKRIQLGMALAEMTTLLVGSTGIKAFTWVLNNIPLVNRLAPLVSAIGHLELVNFINTQQGRTAIATLVTSEFIDIGGGVVEKAAETIKTGLEKAKVGIQDQGQGAKSAEEPSLEPDQTLSTPDETPTKGSTPQLPDQGTWVDISSNVQQNTATGKTRIKRLN